MDHGLARLLCVLVLLACAPLARAQIYHCIGAHGEPVFSGQPCGAPVTVMGADSGPQTGRFAGICAASPEALRRDITAAFTTRDVNRLSGLILWRGIDQASARRILHSLSEWLKEPLEGIVVAYPGGPPAAANGPDAGSQPFAQPVLPLGFEVSTANDTRDFGIAASGGCWWLTFE